ncbi:MAG: hypothetical protein WEC37_03260 [Anaerolineales bacterium]
MLVSVDPPFLVKEPTFASSNPNIHFPESLKGKETVVKIAILATRYVSHTLFPIDEIPEFVYVLMPLINNPEKRKFIAADEFYLLYWAELYETLEDAITKMTKQQRKATIARTSREFIQNLLD